MAKVEDVMRAKNAKKNMGEERTMAPQEPPKPVVEKDNTKSVNTEKVEENKIGTKETDKAQDKKQEKKEEKKADKGKETSKKVEKTEKVPSNEPAVAQSIAPYAPSNMEYGGVTGPTTFAPNDNFEKDNKMNLNVYKKEKKSKTPIRDFIAEVCDMKGYKKGDKKDAVMSKKLALANVIWLGAKLTVACTVFGPIVGSWLTAQYTNKDKATKIEDKMKGGVKYFMA